MMVTTGARGLEIFRLFHDLDIGHGFGFEADGGGGSAELA